MCKLVNYDYRISDHVQILQDYLKQEYKCIYDFVTVLSFTSTFIQLRLT